MLVYMSPVNLENQQQLTDMEKTSATRRQSSAIHSGQFMVSDLDAENEASELRENESDAEHESASIMTPLTEQESYELRVQTPDTTEVKKAKNVSVSIEGSLSRLFQCMNLAYNGKLTSPKWKQFKGLRVTPRDKIRLNNIIWRAWHLQFITRKNPCGWQFASPLEDSKKPDVVVLEGKYWRRKLLNVTSEYKKWRLFFPSRSRDAGDRKPIQSCSGVSKEQDDISELMDFEWFPDEEVYQRYLTDTVFTSTATGIGDCSVNSRKPSNADLMQPGLGQLQPSTIDMDFDTLSPFMSILSSHLPTVDEESGLSDDNSSTAHELQPVFLPPLSSSQRAILPYYPQQYTPIMDAQPFVGTPAKMAAVQQQQQQQQQTVEEVKTERENNTSSTNLTQLSEPSVQQSVEEQIMFMAQRDKLFQQQQQQQLQAQLLQQETQQQSYLQQSFSSDAGDKLDNFFVTAAAPVTSTMGGSQGQYVASADASGYNIQGHVAHRLSRDSSTESVPSVFPVELSFAMQNTSSVSPVQTSVNTIATSIQQQQQSQQIQLSTDVNTDSKHTVWLAINGNMYPCGGATQIAFATPPVSPQQQTQQQQRYSFSTIDIATKRAIRAKQDAVRRHSYTGIQTQAAASPSSLPASPVSSRLSPKLGPEPLLQEPTHAGPVLSMAIAARPTPYVVPSKQHATPGAQGGGLSRQSLSLRPAPLGRKPPIIQGNTFAVPKASASKTRHRSRSMSSPQSGAAATTSGAGGSPSPKLPPPPASSQQFARKMANARSLNNLVVPRSGSADNLNAISNASPNTGRVFPKRESPVHFMGSSGKYSGATSQRQVSTSDSDGGSTATIPSPAALLKDIISTYGAATEESSTNLTCTDPLVSGFASSGFKSNSPSSSQNMSSPVLSPGSSTVASPTFPSASSPIPLQPPPKSSANRSEKRGGGASGSDERAAPHYRERRRVCHINAEQKRRCNIKTGFDSLKSLLPSLVNNPEAKTSKAALLQKGGEHIRVLHAELAKQQLEFETLRKKAEAANEAISFFQGQLPETGVPLPNQGNNALRKRFDSYVEQRTAENWKFGMFSMLMSPLLESFNSTVSKATPEEFTRTTQLWLDQNCALPSLRPVMINSLRQLSTTTNILTDPSQLEEEIRAVIRRQASSSAQSDSASSTTSSVSR